MPDTTPEHRRVAVLACKSIDGIEQTWHFLVPIHMTPDAWRTIVDREIRSLYDLPKPEPDEYIRTATILEVVAATLAKTFPMVAWFETEYVDEVIKDDRGIGRYLDRRLLGSIQEHNDLIDRRDAAEWLRVHRAQRGK